MKPIIRFCWHCGRNLRGNHFAEVEVVGEMKILHKGCVKEASAIEASVRLKNS